MTFFGHIRFFKIVFIFEIYFIPITCIQFIEYFSGECTGPSVRYVTCNMEPCAQSQAEFRAVQCSAHNEEPLDNKYFKVFLKLYKTFF